MSSDHQATRAVEVWRRHRPTGHDMSGRSFWIQVTFENATAAMGAVALILQMILEPAFWWSWPPWRGSQELWGRIALGLLALAPISGALLERYLTHWTPPRLALRPGLHLAFWLLGGLPLAGFFLIPLARRWMNNSSTWVLRPTAACLDLDAAPEPLPRGTRWLWAYRSGVFGIWLTITGVLLPFAGCMWLAAAGGRKTLLVVCIALHLALAGCLAISAESDLRFTRQSRRYLRLASVLCLLPQPVPLLAAGSVLWTVAEAAHLKTLVWSAYAQAGSLRRHSQWLDLRLALQQWWQTGSWTERWTRPQGLELPQRNGRAEAARRTWMRAKTLLLPLEASLAIGWLVALHGSRPGPGYDPISDPALHPWLVATILLAVLGFLQAGAGRLARLLRLRNPVRLGPAAAGLYLGLTQAGLTFALLAGPLAAHGKFRDLALVTSVLAALAAGLFVLLTLFGELFFQSSLTPTTLAAWPAILLILAVSPLALALRPDLAPAGLGLTLLVPVVDAAIGACALPWLLYPFRRRDVFDRGLPTRVRVRLAFVMLVAVLPLGGLLLPGLLKSWTHEEIPGATPRIFSQRARAA